MAYRLPDELAALLADAGPAVRPTSDDPPRCPGPGQAADRCICRLRPGAIEDCGVPMERPNGIWNVFVALMNPVVERDVVAQRIRPGTRRITHLKARYGHLYEQFRDDLRTKAKDADHLNAMLCDIVHRYVGPHRVAGIVVGRTLGDCTRPTKRDRRPTGKKNAPATAAPRAVHERARPFAAHMWDDTLYRRIRSHIKDRIDRLTTNDILAIATHVNDVFLRGFLGHPHGLHQPLRIHIARQAPPRDPAAAVPFRSDLRPDGLHLHINMDAAQRALAQAHVVSHRVRVHPSPFQNVPASVLWLCVEILGAVVTAYQPESWKSATLRVAFAFDVITNMVEDGPSVRPTLRR